MLDLDLLRAKQGSPLADVWLHGKLLSVLLIDRRCRRLFGQAWARLDVHPSATWWRPWLWMVEQVQPIITTSPAWCLDAASTVLTTMQERPRRRRQLQAIPQGILTWLNSPHSLTQKAVSIA